MKIALFTSIYNGTDRKLLNKSIESIMNQEYSEFTILIAVDGYVDNLIYEMLDILKSKYEVEFFLSNDNKGLPFQLNRIFKERKNDFDLFIRHDWDDISFKDRISTLVTFSKDNPNCALFGSWAFYESEKIKLKIKTPIDNNRIRKVQCYIDPFVHGSVVFNLFFFKKFDILYDEKIPTGCEDTDLWSRVVTLNCSNIPKYLYSLQIDDNFINRRKNYNIILINFKNRFFYIIKFNFYEFIPLFLIQNLVRLLPSFFIIKAYSFRAKYLQQ